MPTDWTNLCRQFRDFVPHHCEQAARAVEALDGASALNHFKMVKAAAELAILSIERAARPAALPAAEAWREPDLTHPFFPRAEEPTFCRHESPNGERCPFVRSQHPVDSSVCEYGHPFCSMSSLGGRCSRPQNYRPSPGSPS